MVNENLVRELESIVGKSHVSLTRTGIELYSYDASLVRGNPGLVVFPANTREVSRTVRAAINAGVDFLPRGYGTNLSGGTVSVTEGLVICMSRFNRILEIHPESRYAVVQPGVTNLEVQQALAKAGAFYAPDPASQKVATLGGNAGENSGGPLCLKYGVTANHILGMEMVMADGKILRIGGPALDPPGFDLRGLMVGSEGGLGIFTELTLRILPKTESVITLLAVYDDIQSAALSVSKIISAGIVPNTLEMMDATVIEAVEANAPCGYPTDAAAVLIIEVEGMTVGLKEQAEQIQKICMDTRCRSIKTAKNQEERNRLWQGRRGAFGAIARLAPNYLVNDACVPRTRLPEALEQVKNIAKKYGCRVGNVFHAGDGNLHPLLLFDSRNPNEVEQVHKAGWEIMEACVELGGTISGEHGIGREKQPAMHMIFSGDDLNAQQAVKSAFDPCNVLNPNKVIPLPEKPGQGLPPLGPTVLNRLGGVSAKGVREIMAAVKSAAASGTPVIAVGNGQFEHGGNLGRAEVTLIRTLGLKEVIEHDTANQFITVGAGLTLGELGRLLGEKNQWLPIRPPYFNADSTVGALAAMGVSGPERMYYGAPRDFALGLQYIDARGRIITTGGKVVKNVAGYDMTRLLVGSHGSLGLITEVTWRVCTRPELCRAASGTGNLNACFTAALKLMNANLFPAFITAIPQKNFPSKLPDHWEMRVGFEGLSMVVDHQVDQCQNLLRELGLTPKNPLDYDVRHGCLQEDFARLDASAFCFKAAGIPRKMMDMVDGIPPLVGSRMILDFGCARIFAGLDSLDREEWTAMGQRAPAWGGHIQLDKAPKDFCQGVDMYKESPCPEWDLMRKIKKALDPDSLFSPGRLPGNPSARGDA